MTIRNIYWPDEREAILDHLRQVHGTTDFDMLASWYGSMPDFDPEDVFVIDSEIEGEIAAHAMIVPRQIQIGESVLPVAEINHVGVLEQYRQQGVAHAMVDLLHEVMSERGFALSMLFGLPGFFERWQYEYAVGLYLTSFESEISTDLALKAGRWNLDHSYERRTADQLGARNQEVIIRRFYMNDLPAVKSLYAEASKRGHYMMVRDDRTWDWQLDFLTRTGRNDPSDFLVAEVDGQLVAYVRLATQTPVNWFRGADAARFSVIEAVGEHPDAVEALLGEIAHTAQTFSADRIGLFIHPDSTFMRHLLARGAVRRAFTGAGYLRLHDLPLTLELLAPELERRRMDSRYGGRAYHLVITTEHDFAELRLGMSADPELVELEVPSTSLVRLITGWYGIDHLTTGYHERYCDLLRVLFPARNPKIGLADML